MPEQSEIQGVFDRRVTHLNKFRTGMADIALKFNGVAQDVQVVLMKSEIDVYGDTTNTVEDRITKRAIVTKNPDMMYVQDLFDELVELDDQMPYLVKMTLTGLPRMVNHDDRIIIGSLTYSVSKVAPINRLNDGILKVLIYPERSNPDFV